jgi:hypothetical protein
VGRNYFDFKTIFLRRATMRSRYSGRLSVRDSFRESLSTLLTHFSAQTPAVVSQTTAGRMTTLNWPNASGGVLFVPQGSTATTNYEAVMDRALVIAQGGSYTFETGSDDGNVLFIDGSPVPQVDNNKNQGYTTVDSSPISLSAGLHSLVLGYNQGGGNARFSLSYQGPDTGNMLTLIPDTALFNAGTSGLPSATQSYANNIAVTSNATVDVNGSLAASVGNLSLAASSRNVTSSDLSGSSYSLSVRSLNMTGASGVTVNASAGTGAGTLRVTAAPTFAADKVQFNVSSDSATVGAGASFTVISGAILELAGGTPALDSTANKVSVVNDSSTAGLVVSGTNRVVGAIDGTTQVNAGSDLTADYIIQSALVIGGTAGSSGLVTVDGSDASGNPLAMSSALAVGNTTTPSNLLASGSKGTTGSLDLSSGASGVNSSGGSSISTTLALGGVGGAGGTAAVPEPSAILLVLLGVVACAASIARGKLSLARDRR